MPTAHLHNPESMRAYCALVAATYRGQPYVWGGDDMDEGGFDCSGLMDEVFDHVSREYFEPVLNFGRTNAHGIKNYFLNLGCREITRVEELRPGCMVFFSRRPGSRIFHVKLHIASGPFGFLAIDAGGAGSNSPDLRSALRLAAGVRMSSSIHHGGAAWVAVDPFELFEGGDHDIIGRGV